MNLANRTIRDLPRQENDRMPRGQVLPSPVDDHLSMLRQVLHVRPYAP